MDPINISTTPIKCLAYVPSSASVLAGGDRMSLVNTISGQIDVFPATSRQSTSALTTNGHHHISSNSNIITQWDPVKRVPIRTIDCFTDGIKDHINSVEFMTPNVVVSGGDNCHISLHDFRAGKTIYTTKIASDSVNTVHVASGVAYASSNDGAFEVLDFRAENSIKFTYDDAVIDFKVENNNVVSLFETGTVTVIDVQDKELLNEYKVSDPYKYQIKLDYCAGQLIIGSEHGMVCRYIYDQQKNMILHRDTIPTSSPIITHVKLLDTMTIAIGNDGVLHRLE